MLNLRCLLHYALCFSHYHYIVVSLLQRDSGTRYGVNLQNDTLILSEVIATRVTARKSPIDSVLQIFGT
jgi:hypothetical protein